MLVSKALESSIFAFSSRLTEALHHHLVPADVDAVLVLELLEQPGDDGVVDVITPERRVAVGAHDLDHAVADVEDRDVKGATAEVVDRHFVIVFFVDTVSEGCRRRR